MATHPTHTLPPSPEVVGHHERGHRQRCGCEAPFLWADCPCGWALLYCPCCPALLLSHGLVVEVPA